MISKEEILRGQVCPPELEANLEKLLVALNQFREVYGEPMIVTSGLRNAAHNLEIGGAKNSAHLTCEAADFADDSRVLKAFCLRNLSLLEECGLWLEDPRWTVNWIHLQCREAINRVFIP